MSYSLIISIFVQMILFCQIYVNKNDWSTALGNKIK